MANVSYRLEDLKKAIVGIGYVGENDHMHVLIDCKEVFDEYPDAVATMAIVPPVGESYPKVVNRNGDVVEWLVKNSDVAAEGDGEFQITFTEGEVIKKSVNGRFRVIRSISGSGNAPSGIDDWMTDANEKLAAVEEATQEAEDAAEHQPRINASGYWEIWDAETGAYVATSTKAQGDKGDPGDPGTPGDPTELIDDTAGSGTTGKTWSADKINDVTSQLSTDITKLPEEKGSHAVGVDLDVSDDDGNVILRLKNGNIETKKFYSGTDAPTQGYGSSEESDLDVTDSEGHVIMRLSGGGVQTKNFNSSFIRQLAGKKWACIGDSLTEHNDKATKNYHDYIHEETGIYVYNMGHSGCGYAKVGSYGKNFVGIAEEIPNDVDVITIFGSGNDANMEMDIGTKTDTGSTTLCGYINQTLDVIATNFPLIPLGIITPTPWTNSEPSEGDGRMKQYANAIAEICEWRGIPYLNLYYCSNLHPGNSTFRTLAYSHDGGAGVHPDENGHKIIAPRFREFLFSLI